MKEATLFLLFLFFLTGDDGPVRITVAGGLEGSIGSDEEIWLLLRRKTAGGISVVEETEYSPTTSFGSSSSTDSRLLAERVIPSYNRISLGCCSNPNSSKG